VTLGILYGGPHTGDINRRLWTKAVSAPLQARPALATFPGRLVINYLSKLLLINN
jgi:hypothetical protein